MNINEFSRAIIDCSMKIHKVLGPGLLINFGAPYLKEGINRIVNNLPEANDPPTLNS